MKPPLSSQRDRRPESFNMADDSKKFPAGRPFEPLTPEQTDRVLKEVKAYLEDPRVRLGLQLEKELNRKLSEFYFGEDDPFATKQ